MDAIRVGVAAAMVSVVVGCGGTSGDGGAPELRVAAASDLQAAMPELAEAFGRRTGARLVPVLGSSGMLARQIREGAPYDVFLSANRAFVDELAKVGAIEPDSVHRYARGPLVLAFHDAVDAGLAGLEALDDPAIRSIALANPDHAPYGMAGRQALQRAGLWGRVEPKVVYGQSIRQALQYVATGQAEAGLIARSLADAPGLRWEPIDPALHDPIDQYLGVVAGRPSPELARAFVEMLRGEEGREILRRYGFDLPGD